MKSPSIYEPIGSFRNDKSNIITFNIGILIPVLDNSDKKYSKVKVKELFSELDISTDTPVLLIAFKATKQKHNSNDETGALGDLRSQPNVSFTLDFHNSEIKKPLPATHQALTEVIVINFHTDETIEASKVKDCFREYCKEKKYTFYQNGGNSGMSFSDYYKTQCEDTSEIVQPETSGGGVLVGV